MVRLQHRSHLAVPQGTYRSEETMRKAVVGTAVGTAATTTTAGAGSRDTCGLGTALTANDVLGQRLRDYLVGQDEAIERIAPYVSAYQAGLGPEGRPAGVFLLTGPTGCGKTYFVESLAAVLHGNSKNVLRIDCAEFHLPHETAKLIGAPPGYLGHRETHPLLTQQRLNAVSSNDCGLSLVLFDEVEKGSESLTQLLLGVLDKGQLRLGDNSTVNFANSLVFLTSNLGAEAIQRALDGRTVSFCRPDETTLRRQLESSHDTALRKTFSPEFLNRLDEIVRFEALEPSQVQDIAAREVDKATSRMRVRLGPKCPCLYVTPEAVDWIARKGFSRTEGARPIKRLVERKLVHGFANLPVREPFQTYELGVVGPDLDLRWSVAESVAVA